MTYTKNCTNKDDEGNDCGVLLEWTGSTYVNASNKQKHICPNWKKKPLNEFAKTVNKIDSTIPVNKERLKNIENDIADLKANQLGLIALCRTISDRAHGEESSDIIVKLSAENSELKTALKAQTKEILDLKASILK